MISKELISYIKELSFNDKKTLSQKVLKLFEEGGELAKKALPYDNAHGTLHRFSNRDAIIEEIADVILVALSIGYDIGMDEDDLEEFIANKANYWDRLQQNESATVSNILPYEIHVTVKLSEQLSKFSESCKQIKVKPLLLSNYNIDNESIENVMMISCNIKGTARDADNKLNEIVSKLTDNGFKTIRQKIETVPWHPAASNLPMPLGVVPNRTNLEKHEIFYFEKHMKIRILENDFSSLTTVVNNFKLLSKNDACGISWNSIKPLVDGVRTYFITYRSKHTTKEEFESRAEKFLEHISKCKKILSIFNENIEFAIYDTAEIQDKTWIRSLV